MMTPTPSDEVPVPVERVSLGNCPPGPFIFNGTLGFKTEYGPTDAYCMGTGEAFWGGTTDKIARAALLVQPVEVAALSPATDKGEVERLREALKLAHNLIETIEQSSGNVWWVNADDPETAVCDTFAAVEATLQTKDEAHG